VNTNATDNPEVVIVGAGIGGALLADKLAAQGVSVLILEAGTTVSRQDAVARYRSSWRRDPDSAYTRQPHASFPAKNEADPYLQTRGSANYWVNYLRQVGGSTWHWTGITPRFLPSDFELRSRYGVGRDWPFGYTEIEPYYVKAEHEMGVSGDSQQDSGSPRSAPYPMPPIAKPYSDQVIAGHIEKHGFKVNVAPAARNSQPYNGRPACCGNNSCTPICPIGAQYSADTHVRSAINKGARLMQNAVAYNLNVNASGNIASLDYKTPDGASHSLRARHFASVARPY